MDGPLLLMIQKMSFYQHASPLRATLRLYVLKYLQERKLLMADKRGRQVYETVQV